MILLKYSAEIPRHTFIHEGAHVVVAEHLGMPVRSVVLHSPFEGETSVELETDADGIEKAALMSLAGFYAECRSGEARDEAKGRSKHDFRLVDGLDEPERQEMHEKAEAMVELLWDQIISLADQWAASPVNAS